MRTLTNPRRRLVLFVALVVALSVPLWVAAQAMDATTVLPMPLPLSALQFVCVLVAAVLVTRWGGDPMGALLARGGDVSRLPGPGWRVAVFAVMPIVVWVAFLVSTWVAGGVSASPTPLLAVLVLLVVYAVSGYCEEVGWTGVMTDGLLGDHGVVRTGLITGAVWAGWHLIPYLQTHHAWDWIAWQCAFTVVFRVLITALYVPANRSLFATIALHATYNTAVSALPFFGSSYSPFWTTVVTVIVLIGLLVRWPGLWASPTSQKDGALPNPFREDASSGSL